MEIVVSKLNDKPLRDFINLILKLDKTTYFLIDNQKMSTKMYDEQRSAVLINSIDTSSVIELESQLTKPVKIALFEGVGSRFLKYLDLFEDSEMKLKIYTLDSDHGGCDYAEKIELYDERLKMTIMCQDPNLEFIYLDDEKEAIVFDKEEAKYNFSLSDITLSKINKLADFSSSDDDLIEIYSNESGVHFSKQGLFDIVVNDELKAINPKGYLFKKFVSRIPIMNYNVYVFKNKILFYSMETDLKLAINLAITD